MEAATVGAVLGFFTDPSVSGFPDYNPNMTAPLLGLLFVSIAATQFTPEPSSLRRLNSTLLTLQDPAAAPAVRQQLSADLLIVSDPQHRPAQKSLRPFVDQLVSALSGKQQPAAARTQLSAAILEVLHSAGVGTHRFRAAIDRSRDALTNIGVSAVDAARTADLLRAVGNDVRGPDDMPLTR